MSTLHNNAEIERLDTEYHRKLKYTDREHTPSNRVYGTEQSCMIVTYEAHRKGDWLHLWSEEIRFDKANRMRSVSHSVTFNNEQALALRDMLLEQFPLEN